MCEGESERYPNSVNSQLLRSSELKNQYTVALITIELNKDKGPQKTQGIHETQGTQGT
jgi:hypothetical protein